MKPKRIIRADALRSSANRAKVNPVLRFIRDFRKVAVLVGREQWRLVFTTGWTKRRFTNDDKALGTICGAAPVQMARDQVSEQIDGWLSNRSNEFRAAVQHSTLQPEIKHQLHSLNRAGAIYRPSSFKMRDGTEVPAETRRLARNIMRCMMNRHRKPNLSRISPRIDQRCATLEQAKTATLAEFWLRLRLPKRGTIFLPVHDNPHRQGRQAPLCKAVQLVAVNDDLGIRVLSDVTERYAAERAAYEPDVEDIALDFGLTTMFASSEGDLLGRNWLTQLRRYDAKLQSIAKHMQRIGKKPRDSRRFRALTADVRGFIRTEVNRVINALVVIRKPAHLILERLDFRNSELSRRLNRILSNCGRSVIKEKLADLEQRLGITSEEDNPAYSSQECELCGFVSRDNRPSQNRFACRWCGHTAHADVNAARCLRSRRSGSPGALVARGQKGALVELARRFFERMKTQPQGRRGDALKRSAFRKLGVDHIALHVATVGGEL